MGHHTHHDHPHVHGETGITDEAAVEAHDIMENAEKEEQKLHPNDSMTADQPASKGSLGGAPQKQESMMDKVKDTLNLGKK